MRRKQSSRRRNKEIVSERYSVATIANNLFLKLAYYLENNSTDNLCYSGSIALIKQLK